MPEFKPVSAAHIAAIERPACPKCSQRRMLLSNLGSRPCGSAIRSFECQNCGHTSTAVVPSDPLTSNVLGWLASELRPPT
ncbi:response regulator [Bradyrhizobium sp.]|uniref:response regulator n=1 Tax=Bradyrhizobium sp. TaxID=376 RepID=UPI0025BF06C3|nr:response regulator [Bradyrhizobium sp.]